MVLGQFSWFFMIPGRFSWFFVVSGWFLLLPGGFLWFFMVSGWLFMVPGWFSWCQVGFPFFHVESTLKLYSGPTIQSRHHGACLTEGIVAI